jgi:CBS domain-containing protein
MRICELIKDQDTYRADVNQNVLEVVQAMVERNIGAVPVLSEGLLVGIFSERDLMRRVVAEGRMAHQTPLWEVMTGDPLTISPEESLENCLILMRRHSFRHLPVCEGKLLRGMISMRDLILQEVSEKDYEVRMMRAYIQAAPDV